MVIVDESSSFKDASSKRFRSLKMNLGRIRRMILLTGTPIGNGLMDLWAQIYLLDQGERLYPTITEYRMRYFYNPEYRYIPLTGAEEIIYEKLQGLVISMKNADYLNLPERIDVTIPVKFSDQLQKKYDDFERECVMNLPEGEITAFSSGALSIKLLQFANGAIYDAEGKTHQVHDLKMEALDEILESAGQKPALILYTFKHDLERIQKKYKTRMFRTEADVTDWNQGKIPIAIGHPLSMGHGLNLQEGNTIMIWFGQTWSLELYEQTVARLLRQGRKEKLYIYRIVAEKTMDEDVIKALAKKANTQDALMNAVRARVEKYTSEMAK
jgi:SNF2 family DNA or RNA helicase